MKPTCNDPACAGPWGCRFHGCPCKCHPPKRQKPLEGRRDPEPKPHRAPGMLLQFAPKPKPTAPPATLLVSYYEKMLMDYLSRPTLREIFDRWPKR